MAHYGRGEEESTLRGEERRPPPLPKAPPLPEMSPIELALRYPGPSTEPVPSGPPRIPAGVERAFAVAKGVPIAPGLEAKVDFGRRMLKLVKKF
jgi:hypothetical protein